MTQRASESAGPRAMGLRDRNKARRRQAILDATKELLRASPDREPTREQIAELAEVAPATVYNLIGDRGQIWAALAAEFMTGLDVRLAAVTDRDPLVRVRRIVEVTAKILLEDPVVAAEVLRGLERSGVLLRRGPVTPIQQALQAAQDEGLLRREVRAGVLARNITTACVGAVHQWAAGELDDTQLCARVRVAAELTMAAVASEAARERLLRSLQRRGRGRR